jgi:hypothetical protein
MRMAHHTGHPTRQRWEPHRQVQNDDGPKNGVPPFELTLAAE